MAPALIDQAKDQKYETAQLLQWADADQSRLLTGLRTSSDGLSRVESLLRLERDGFNEIAAEKLPAWYVQYLQAYHTPFNYLLLGLAVISSLTGDLEATVIISMMVAISGSLRFWQERRSGLAAEQLKSLVRTTATVIRPGGGEELDEDLDQLIPESSGGRKHRKVETPLRELAVGDVVMLSAGDLVPADVRLLLAKDLFISQATLTGESLPVEKFAICPSGAQAIEDANNPLESSTLGFMGTSVVSGSALAVVLATGNRTYLGSLARNLVGSRVETSFDTGVRNVSWFLIRLMLLMVPLVFFINGFTKGDWGEAFLFGLAVAVGLTPEMLPMIVTANLAKSAISMSHQKVIVKRLHAIQNLGAIDVLCTDKTGTLTQDKVVLLRHLDIQGNESQQVLEYAYLNSYYQTGLKNLLDRAILDHEDLTETRSLAERFLKRDEIPFDFNRRRMSVVVHEILRGNDWLICKGATEEILNACTFVQADGHPVAISPPVRQAALQLSNELSEDGLRVIAVAVKQVPSSSERQYGVQDEEGMILVGFIAFLDPPKETAEPALKALAQHGVSVKILTGDNASVAKKICKDVGLDAPRTLLGPVIDVMSESELETQVEDTVLFAKLNPNQKARIVLALRRRGHTVGFLGDGINDAPALRFADAGISVDTGTDIAKESADIILLEKSLMVLEEGVLLGRQTYGNTIKYIKMAASSNFGNVFSVLVASAFLPFLPMLPIHLLIQNLLYDISQIGIPFDKMDEEYLEEPKKWQVEDLGRFMLCIGPISSIFDITTFALMYYVFQANSPETQSLFHSGWFVLGLLSQTLIIHMIRTAKIPFLQSMATPPLMILTLIIMAIGVMLPYSPIGASVGLVPLPLAYFPWLIATLMSYCLLTQLIKVWYCKKFGMWL